MKRLLSSLALICSFALPVTADEVKKIASAGGDITEILFEFGVDDRVVAVDTTSIYPPEVNALPRIG